jgi:hypothetical protein
LNCFHSHFVEIILAVIFRKFKILLPKYTERKDFKDDETSFLIEIGFDKAKDAKDNFIVKQTVENYIEVLDAYSMLFFSIVGDDLILLKKKIAQFKNFTTKYNFDFKDYYLDFLKKIEEFEYWKNPFIVVILKNYILCSSELFFTKKEEMMKNFLKMEKTMIPKIEEYMNKELKKVFKLFEKKENIKEIEISLSILKNELAKIIKEKNVVDKYIKYDEKVRSE